MPKASGDVRVGGAIPADVKPDPRWGREFQASSGFTIIAARVIKAFVFMDRRLAAGEPSRRALAKSSFTMAHIICKDPDVDWHVDAEPIDEDQMGLIAYTSKGKPILAGTYIARTGTIQLETLYPNITNVCKNKVKVTATYTSDDGSTKVGGSYEAEWT